MIKFDPIFSNGAILQAQKPVRVCGIGDGELRVSLGALSITTTAEGGRWCAEFPAQDYGTVCNITASNNESSITINDVTFGDVFLIAGQSNMQFKLHEGKLDGEIYECNDIRCFFTDRLEENERFATRDGWVKCRKDTATHFSSIGYFVARDLHKRDGRPIGLVACYQGASVIQSWMSEKALAELALDMPDGELHWDHHNPAFSKWNGTSTLYNFAFSQARNFSYKAVLWYQGESNSSECESCFYDKMLIKMIELWRNDLCDVTLPFIVIQIADFDSRNDAPWHRVQEAQRIAVEQIENCKLIVCKDICETDNIHPPTKHILAQRIVENL